MTTTPKTQSNQERLMQVILAPHISEKSTVTADKFRQFVFRVVSNAKKNEVKQAVEMLFNVQVESVNVCNVKGKKKYFKQMLGSRKGWKKAYVALKEGNDIDFTGMKK